VPYLLLLAFCTAIGLQPFQIAKKYIARRFGTWTLPVAWLLVLGSILVVYVFSFHAEDVYQTPIHWSVVVPTSGFVTLFVLCIFMFA